MMEGIFPEISDDASHVRSYFRNTPSPLSSVLHQEFVSAANFGPEAIASLGAFVRSELFDDDLLTPDEYRASEFYRDGINISPDGVKRSMAESLAAAHDRRLKRDLVLDRARQGFGISAMRFGAGIVGSVLDPVNVGVSIFAPVAVGLNATARATAIKATSGITQKYGVTAGRVAAGAGEAAIGATAIEPILYAGTRIQQDPDYDLFDSFVNVTIGAILGGTITGVGGKFSDVLRRADPETNVQAMQVATSQVAEGMPVRVDAIFDADMAVSPQFRAEGLVKRTRQEIDELIVKPPRTNELPPSLKAKNKTPTTLRGFIQKKGKIDPKSIGVAELKQDLDAGGFSLLKKNGLPVQRMIEAAQEEGYFPAKVDMYEDEVTLEEFLEAVKQNPYSSIDSVAADKVAADDLYEQVMDLGINPKGMTDEELFEEIARRQDALTEAEAAAIDEAMGPGITQEQLDAEIAYTQQMYESGAGLSEFEPYADELTSLSKDLDARLASEPSAVKAMDDDIDLLERKFEALRMNTMPVLGPREFVPLDVEAELIQGETIADAITADEMIARQGMINPSWFMAPDGKLFDAGDDHLSFLFKFGLDGEDATRNRGLIRTQGLFLEGTGTSQRLSFGMEFVEGQPITNAQLRSIRKLVKNAESVYVDVTDGYNGTVKQTFADNRQFLAYLRGLEPFEAVRTTAFDEEIAELREYDDLIARVDELQPVIESGAACVIKRR